MASTYVNDLRLNEMATGDASGSWGTVTNTNLELIAEAFSFGTEAITTNANTHTTTIADGGTDPGRSMFLKYTGTLDSACTITIGPNTVSKLWFIENGTSGSQNIIIKQGSGATITIPPGDTKAIYSDGAGSGGKMVDAFASLSVVDLKVQDDLTVTDDVAIGGLATVGETLAVTGVLTTTAATVFNGGFAANAVSTINTTGNESSLILTSTSANAALGPNLRLYRNSSSPANNDVLGTLRFTGRNNNSQDVDYAEVGVQIRDVSDGSEDTNYFINTMTAGTIRNRINVQPTEVVLNDESIDVDFRVESNGNENMLFVDGGGNHVNIGTASATTVGGSNGGLNVFGTTDDSWVNMARFSANNGGTNLQFGKSRNATVGSQTVVQDGDTLGQISFAGSDGTDMNNYGAEIRGQVDGTPGANDMPGRLVFKTTADGASSPTERLRINNAGALMVNTAATGTDASPTVSSTGLFSMYGATSAASFSAVSQGTTTGYLNRNTSDGIILDIRKANTTVGNISTQGGRLSIGSGDVNLNFNASANSMYPISDPTAGTLSDNVINVGAATARFKDLYLGGGVYLGGTAATNKLDDVESGLWTATIGGTSGNPSSVTYLSQSSMYTKVGDIVTVTGTLGFTTYTGGSGTLQIVGLPYTAANVAPNYTVGATLLEKVVLTSGYTWAVARTIANATYLEVIEAGTNIGWRGIQVGQYPSSATGKYINFTVTYRAA